MRLLVFIALALVACDAPHDLGKVTMREAVNADPNDFARFLIEHDLHERSDDHTILTASLGLDSMMFGDGSDGDCAYDGSNPVVGDSPAATSVNATISQATTYTLTGWRFCHNLTITSNVAINAPYPIYVSGLLTLNSNTAIVRNGCKSNANTTPCGRDAGGFLSGMSGSEDATMGGTCFRKLIEFDQSSSANCAVAVNGGGVGNNGVNGTTPTLTGCGGGAGSVCNQATAGAGRASPHNTVTLTTYGSADPYVADGYISFIDGSNGAACSSATGGGTGSDGATLLASGGGGAGWVVVHAFEWTGSGTIEARGGTGFTYTVTNSCIGGGGGGGGGFVSFMTATGTTFPTIDISGGAGAAGTVCASGACTGLHGGAGANGFQGFKKTFHQSN